ncbi:glycosyl transferase [Rhodococcoides trifolii]|uniref:Glycosyl transferase n=1 Tax=Rhodococcoides trifolii TaxID=908250 RepID=A0A917G319_9NOCA|nr:glycosyltransferase [Rhodococcus trifolii]GGG20189.1 glycosyl transferase [Rhodococcus trifolii]
MFTPPTQLVAVVPAHNEAELLPRCLDALSRAAASVLVPVTIVVVLDACDDDTASVVPQGIEVVEIVARNVGAARAAGFASVAAELGSDAWLTTTDADSTVESGWFHNHLAHAAHADAAAGTVRVDAWPNHSTAVQRLFHEQYAAAQGNSTQKHVHGASLGIRADAYWSVGGFRPLAVGEDQDLVDRLIAAGRPVAWADDLCVATSDRTDARAGEGFAHHLRSLAVPS